MSRGHPENLTGRTFGGWSVLGRGTRRGKRVYWACRCTCGAEVEVDARGLLYGHSLGCWDCGVKRRTKHGMHGTRLYKIWRSMIDRCNGLDEQHARLYRGRGIKVCVEWGHDAGAFCNWALANGYKEGLTIDRIDNDGNYEPNNCRWATKKEQQRNKRDNRPMTIDGETNLLCEWAETAGLSVQVLHWRAANGWPDDRILAPLQGGPNKGQGGLRADG